MNSKEPGNANRGIQSVHLSEVSLLTCLCRSLKNGTLPTEIEKLEDASNNVKWQKYV